MDVQGGQTGCMQAGTHKDRQWEKQHGDMQEDMQEDMQKDMQEDMQKDMQGACRWETPGRTPKHEMGG